MCERIALNFEFLCGEDRNVCASKEVGVLLQKAVLGWMDEVIQRASLQRCVESLAIKMIVNRQSDSVCLGNRIYFLNRSI